MTARVLVGVTDATVRKKLVRALGPETASMCRSCEPHEVADQLAREAVDLVLLEARPGCPHLAQALAWASRAPEPARVVLLCRDAECDAALADPGLRDVAVLGLDWDPRILAFAIRSLALMRGPVLARTPATTSGSELPLVAESAAMREVVSLARKVATSRSPVLLLGETGVGKERVAELIHGHSGRSEGPFLAINCAAVPAELFESELFGFAQGAFTGASRSRRGLLEAADGGTLMLDEVGELPGQAQSKLLRVLQDGCVRPLGSDASVKVDVRVIAATNRDLQAEVKAGRFRDDLYYRLAVVEILVPPLRGRTRDIAALVRMLVDGFARELGRTGVGLAPAALAALECYAWPGNVRELVNVVERAVLLAEGERVELHDLPVNVGAAAAAVQASEVASNADGEDPPPPWRRVRESLLAAGERAYLAEVLRRSQGRVGAAALAAGLSERALFEKLRRHGIRKEEFRPARAPGKKK